MKAKKARIIPAVICIALVLLFSNSILALEAKKSSIDVKVKQTNYYVHPGENLEFEFEFANLYDGSDDSMISQVDLYLLDLSNAGLEVESFEGEDWEGEFIEQYNDHHFWIQNASSQKLTVFLKSLENAVPGSYNLTAYFQFYDDEGSTIGLGDNKALLPLNDLEKHYFTSVTVLAPGQQAPLFSFNTSGNDSFLLYAIVGIAIIAIIAGLFYFSKRQKKTQKAKSKK